MTAQQSILDALMAVIDEDHAIAVMEHRNAKRAKLTPHAAKLLAKQFALCADPNEGADEMILRGWTGFKPGWVRDRDLTRVSASARRPAMTGNGLVDALMRQHH